jgi:hypothetical protein
MLTLTAMVFVMVTKLRVVPMLQLVTTMLPRLTLMTLVSTLTARVRFVMATAV